VLGHANRANSEVDIPACEAEGIPVLRRISGGGTVLQGPGCLNYALILRNRWQDPFMGIAQTHGIVLGRHQKAMEKLLGKTVCINANDLTLGGRKFSGNAQRRKRNAVLYHGTFLCDFDLEGMEQLLRMPSRQPAHRGGRTHRDFLANLGVTPAEIKEALQKAWDCAEKAIFRPSEKIQELVNTVYNRREWNFKY
jgi:lipoate-protein ligase A